MLCLIQGGTGRMQENREKHVQEHGERSAHDSTSS